jgi:hypothetical protein
MIRTGEKEGLSKMEGLRKLKIVMPGRTWRASIARNLWIPAKTTRE